MQTLLLSLYTLAVGLGAGARPAPQEASPQELDPRAWIERLSAELRSAGFDLEGSELSVTLVDRGDIGPDLERQMDPFFADGYWELTWSLYRMLGHTAWADVAAMRASIGRIYSSELLAYYVADRDELVLIEGSQAEGESSPIVALLRGGPPSQRQRQLEEVVLHELVHAWRDARSDLDRWIRAEPRTLEAAQVRMCLSEGEAQAVALFVLLARDGGDLSALDLESAISTSFGNPSLMLRYRVGLHFALQQWRAGGWPALDRRWNAPLPSSEELLHPEKLDHDRARTVTLPAWPEELDDAELVHADVIGEFGIRMILGELGVEANAAELAACGWDGDRIELYRGEQGEALLWRTIWDRPEDAQQFVSTFRRLADGRPLRRGRVVDWVHAWDIRTRRKLLEHLESLPVDAPEVPGDVASTAAIEARLDRSKARLEGGTWIVPQADLRLPAPAGWSVQEVGGAPFLMAEPENGFRSNINVNVEATFGVADRQLALEGSRAYLEQVGYELLSSSMLEQDGHPALDLEYSGEANGFELHWRTRSIALDGRMLHVTATLLESAWDELESEIAAALAGIAIGASDDE